MPLYSFIDLSTGATEDLFFTMKDAPKTGSVIQHEGRKLRRELTTSQLATAGIKPIDPHSQKAFRDKTGSMKGGTLGQLWDLSRELSEKRAAKEGVDSVKEAYYTEYSKQKKGRTHIAKKKEVHDAAIKDLNTKLKKFDVQIGKI